MQPLFWVAPLLCFAALAESTPEVLRIPQVERAPKLADLVNGVPRERELAITDFRQMDPANGAPVSQPTTAYLSFDAHNLYVGWICKDDPSKVRVRIAKRKDIESDDRVTGRNLQFIPYGLFSSIQDLLLTYLLHPGTALTSAIPTFARICHLTR